MYMKIVCIISFYNLLYSVANIIGEQHVGSAGCYFQAILSRISCLSSVFWTVLLTRLLHRIVMLNQHFPMVSIVSIQGMIASLLPIVLTLVPLTTGTTFGPVDGREFGLCFLAKNPTSPHTTLIWLIVTFYFWVWGCVVLILYIFQQMIRHMKNMFSTDQSEPVKGLIYRQFAKFLPYPFIIVICWVLPTIADLAAAENTVEPFPFVSAAKLMPLLVGFLNTIVFILYNYDIVSAEWRHIFKVLRWQCCSRKLGVDNSSNKISITLSEFTRNMRWARGRGSDAQNDMTVHQQKISVLDLDFGGALRLKPQPSSIGTSNFIRDNNNNNNSQFQPIFVDDKSIDEATTAVYQHQQQTIQQQPSCGTRVIAFSSRVREPSMRPQSYKSLFQQIDPSESNLLP